MNQLFSKNSVYILGALALGGLGTGCSAMKNMEDMKKTTEGMADDTKKLISLTEDVNQTSSDLKALTEFLYSDSRQKETKDIRNSEYDRMKSAARVEAKIEAAAAYNMAFEFQVWKDSDQDTQAKRERLLEDAVTEYFYREKQFTSSSPHEKRSVAPTSDDQNMLNLYALAVTLHEVNPNLKDLAAAKHFRTFSLLDLFEETLLRRSEFESCATPCERPYETIILRNVQDVIYLLKLRANFLPAMALARMSSITEDSGFLGIKGFLRKTKMFLWDWDSQTGDLSLAQLRETALWLQKSVEVQSFLRSIGQDPRIDGKLVSIYKNLKLDLESEDAGFFVNGTGQKARIQSVRDVALTHLKSQIDSFVKIAK